MKSLLFGSLRVLERTARSVADRASAVPQVRRFLEEHHGAAFARDVGGPFHGVYASFAEAIAAAPPGKPIGYDQAGPANLYRARLDRVYPSDYPVLLWMQRLLRPDSRVFDVGGHVGIAYHAYRRYLTYGPEMRWVNQDVPAVVRAGEELLRERPAPHLEFTTRLEDIAGSDLVLASGSLQYIESPTLAELLRPLPRKPRVLIINRTPLGPGPEFVTLQNIRVAVCPYRIFDQRAFTDSLTALGYEVRDVWDCPEHDCPLPLHPDRSLEAYKGMCLELRG